MHKAIFMGSPGFAAEILRELAKHYEVCGVVTQPDKPAGRGKRITAPAVKDLALELGLEVIQPHKMKDPGVQDQLVSWGADFIVVAAFGKILRPNILNLTPFGCINVHASYLPRWRGAAPIQAAILHGDAQTGISIMKMDEGIDTGPILLQEYTAIKSDETTTSLTHKLAQVGRRLLPQALAGYLSGAIIPSPQRDENATYAPVINKDDGLLNFMDSADSLERKVRAFNEWPGAYMLLNGEILKVRRAKVIPGSGTPGVREIADGFPCVNTANGKLALLEVKPAGKNWMMGSDFLRGSRVW